MLQRRFPEPGAAGVYNDLDDGTKDLILRTAGIAAASGPVLKIAGTATTGVGKLTSGVGKLAKDLGKLSAAKKGAQAIGEVGSKAVQSVEGVSGFSKALIKPGLPRRDCAVGRGRRGGHWRGIFEGAGRRG